MVHGGQTSRYCFVNNLDLLAKRFLPASPLHKTFLVTLNQAKFSSRDVFQIIQNMLLIVTSKFCLSSNVLRSGQTDKLWIQSKSQMFGKQCLICWQMVVFHWKLLRNIFKILFFCSMEMQLECAQIM